MGEVKDDLFVSGEGEVSEDELKDLVDSDAEEEFKVDKNENLSESDDDSSDEDNNIGYTKEPVDQPGKTKRHSCNYCEKKFYSKSHLKEHEYVHTGDFPIKCGVCGKGFRRPRALQTHRCSAHVASAMDQQIPPGGLVTSRDHQQVSSRGQLTSPIENNAVQEGLFSCSTCNYSTDHGVQFNNHLTSKEHLTKSKEAEFSQSDHKHKCLPCLFTSADKYHFDRHLECKRHIKQVAEHNDRQTREQLEDSRLYSCEHCGLGFKDLACLDEHLVEHKEEELKHKEEDLKESLDDDPSKEDGPVSRSGRKIKVKRFHDSTLATPSPKRRHVSRDKVDTFNDTLANTGLAKMPRKQTASFSPMVTCDICPATFPCHTDLFHHMVTHVPEDVLACSTSSSTPSSLSELGWCPHCPGPVLLSEAEEHMVNRHQDRSPSPMDVVGVVLTERKDEEDEEMEDDINFEVEGCAGSERYKVQLEPEVLITNTFPFSATHRLVAGPVAWCWRGF